MEEYDWIIITTYMIKKCKIDWFLALYNNIRKYH